MSPVCALLREDEREQKGSGALWQKLRLETKRVLFDISRHVTKYCEQCQKHGKSPGRFKFNLRGDVSFNYSMIVDILYISGKPVLHVVDEGTRYQAGRCWLQNISAIHTWYALTK
jgi:hypothetical protein